MNRLESMGVFLTVVEEGGFTAASRKLRMPVATVSRKVAELEAHLKVQLFVRTTRRVLPSRMGESYYRDCKRVLTDLQDAEKAVTGEDIAPRGKLTLTAPLVFGRVHMAPLLAEFLALYPDIAARLVLADSILDLQDERIDLALRIGRLPDSSMHAVTLGQVRRVTLASPLYLARHGTPRHPRELTAHSCIAFSATDGTTQWDYLEEGKQRRIAVQPRLTVTSAEAAIAAAQAGLGVTRALSYQVESAAAQKQVSLLLRKFEPKPLPVSLVFMTDRQMPRKLRAFIDFAGPKLKAALASR